MITGAADMMIPEDALFVQRKVFLSLHALEFTSTTDYTRLGILAARYPKEYSILVERARVAKFSDLFGEK